MPPETDVQLQLKMAKRSQAEMVADIVRKSFMEYRRGRRGPKSAFLTARSVRRHVHTRRKFYVIAYMGEKPVGVVAYRVRRARMIFGPVGVPPVNRRKGVGSALMQWIEGRARARKCLFMRGIVLRELRPLILFYERLGFCTYRNRKRLVMVNKKLY